MATWPSTLPQLPDRDGYSDQLQKITLRTEMDQGVAKSRRRFTAAARDRSISLLLTTAQTLDLDQFYLDNASLTWDWINPRGGGVVSYRFKDRAPKYAYVGGDMWRATIDLEQMP